MSVLHMVACDSCGHFVTHPKIAEGEQPWPTGKCDGITFVLPPDWAFDGFNYSTASPRHLCPQCR